MSDVYHLILAIAILATYGVLTVAGYDATPVLGILAGQAVGVGIERGTKD